MAKSQNLNFTQTLNNVSLQFNPADTYQAIQVAVTSVGSNLTPGTRTFTLAGGTLVSGGAGAATFTMPVKGAAGAGYVAGPVTMTNAGDYTVGAGPTAAANLATADSGSSNATFAVTVGILKTLYTASANDAVVKAINVASTDSAARIMTLWEQDVASGIMNIIGSINIPLTAGTGSGTIAAIDLLGGTILPSLPYDANGKRVFPLKVGTKLLISLPAVTVSTFISVHAMIEEY
ncbi:hypothetical protein UFOVP84_34 [uncultured Caudovirales phage]|uniref:Uncharacterized protein n=1 Tax=uncultured Caudovirales phage TaxID=2100421 RepID=A0A6J5L316_9CAUD|nr:hypothetical protein UFOVP84_34 [uncultured Caudovirales phage]